MGKAASDTASLGRHEVTRWQVARNCGYILWVDVGVRDTDPKWTAGQRPVQQPVAGVEEAWLDVPGQESRVPLKPLVGPDRKPVAREIEGVALVAPFEWPVESRTPSLWEHLN